jgi:hypothetical protein
MSKLEVCVVTPREKGPILGQGEAIGTPTNKGDNSLEGSRVG